MLSARRFRVQTRERDTWERAFVYNPNFWEVRLDHSDLERYPDQSALWFETIEERRLQRRSQARARRLFGPVMEFVSASLTQRQREALLLYFIHGKTQEEVAEIMGINRRVVSQHLFGIRRNGRQVGGAVPRLRRLCRQHGISAES